MLRDKCCITYQVADQGNEYLIPCLNDAEHEFDVRSHGRIFILKLCGGCFQMMIDQWLENPSNFPFSGNGYRKQ